MKLFKRMLYVTVALMIGGCGDDSSSDPSPNRSYTQDVRSIGYRLSHAQLSVGVVSTAGENESLNKEVNYSPTEAKDKVQRVIQDGNFVMMVNDKAAALRISSSGTIDHTLSPSESSPGCQLNGTSRVSGDATNLNLHLVFDLSAELTGDTCDQTMRDKLLAFENSEIDGLNLQAVRDLLAATDSARNNSKKITLHLDISGDGY